MQNWTSHMSIPSHLRQHTKKLQVRLSYWIQTGRNYKHVRRFVFVFLILRHTSISTSVCFFTLDIDECAFGKVCPPNSYCKNTPGSFNCECKQGFSLVSHIFYSCVGRNSRTKTLSLKINI